MTFWNCDGSPANMCGNAALCSTRLAAHLQMVPPAGMTLATGAGPFPTRCVGDGDLAELNLPDFDLPAPVPGMALAPGELWIRKAVVGVEHLVTRVADLEGFDLPARGREQRFAPGHRPEGGQRQLRGRAGQPRRALADPDLRTRGGGRDPGLRHRNGGGRGRPGRPGRGRAADDLRVPERPGALGPGHGSRGAGPSMSGSVGEARLVFTGSLCRRGPWKRGFPTSIASPCNAFPHNNLKHESPAGEPLLHSYPPSYLT